jgi:hypothetical protein
VVGKPRVHELAKELGVESKIALAKLKEMGYYVRSASSTVEAPAAQRLREAFVGFTYPQVAAKAPPSIRASSVTPPPSTRAVAPRSTPLPAVRPPSAHDIEVAAAEVRAAVLKAEMEAAVEAARLAAADRESAGRRRRIAPEDTTPLRPARSARIETSSDLKAAQVTALLLLWDRLSSLAPNPDRCVEYLASRGGLPKSDAERLRTVRNRCAHPAGRGWPSSYELAMALATGRELERRLT